MSPDSLKRLLSAVVGVALNLLGPKLGLTPDQISGANTILGIFLAQSGVKAGLAQFAASKYGKVAGQIESAVVQVAKAAEGEAK